MRIFALACVILMLVSAAPREHFLVVWGMEANEFPAHGEEATFITKRDALFDQAIDRVRVHTDTVSASVLVADGSVHRAERSYGEQTADIQENDPAILTLKAHHRPIDPHAYTTLLKARGASKRRGVCTGRD